MLLLSWSNAAVAHNHASEDANLMNLDQLTEAFGWDFDSTKIETEKVAEGLYVLFGVGGNIGVSIGEDGVLIVDNQFPQVMDKIEAAIAGIGGEGVDYAINTHWHFDHAEGNNALGPRGTTIVAHKNARVDMAAGGIVNLVISKYNNNPTQSKLCRYLPLTIVCRYTSTITRSSCFISRLPIQMAIPR